ncbi:MAG TPA: hypothetical protein VJJ52_04415 [Candidatus Nanoarchaeia archaeon]|nr:hypothetical protein [Candidatus Nanoarchaeia archaeon]
MSNGYNYLLYKLNGTPPPWQEGQIVLSATQIPIELPPNVQIRYVGNHPFESKFKKYERQLGDVIRTRDKKSGKIQLTIDFKTLRRDIEALHILGHEEGHLCHLTGNLMALYAEARRLGYHFRDLSEDYARVSDQNAKKVLQNPPKDLELLCSFIFRTSLLVNPESFADIGGLIGLIKSGVDVRVIDAVAEEIANHGGFWRMPELLKNLSQ